MRGNKLGKVSTKSAIKAQIDENLRHAYQSVLKEDVPDRFKELLERLQSQESQKRELQE